MSSNKKEATPGSGALGPIAVLGYSCLFPGDAIDAQSFWKMMVERRSAMTEVPESRMSLSGWHHPAQGRRGQVRSILIIFCRTLYKHAFTVLLSRRKLLA